MNMYKVIVVDDETWICKLIRKIVNWNDLGFEIIADAGDGLGAEGGFFGSIVEVHGSRPPMRVR